MIILLELHELRELARIIRVKEDPDVPVDEGALAPDAIQNTVSDILDLVFSAEIDRSPELLALYETEDIKVLVDRVLYFITSRLILRENICWFKVFDHTGGIAISVRQEPGNANHQ
jgi:hypothetical protein